MRIATLLAGLALLSCTAAAAPCGNPAAHSGHVACADPELSVLLEHLTRYYSGALHALGEGGSTCLETDHNRWLQSVEACTDRTCLKEAYLDRLAELHPLQPGANTITTFELPRYPELVWVIPPAADTEAAPPRPEAPPLEVTGRLVDATSDGDGFMLQTSSGEEVLVEMLMFIEPDTAARLTALAADNAAAYRVSGRAGSEGAAFEPSHCRFIHRIPSP